MGVKIASFASIFLLSCLANFVLADVEPLFVPGRRIDYSRKKNTALRKDEGSYCDGEVIAHCLDCEHIAICVGENEVSYRRCDRQFPFCVSSDFSADCSNDFDGEVEECTPDVSNFICTQLGYFPNPYFCNIYHICDGVFGHAVAYECPNNYVYHAKSRNCVKKHDDEDCVTIRCDEANGSVWAAYGESTEYYAFCPFNTILKEGSDDIIMYKCPEGFSFDGVQCAYECFEEGRFPDAHNEARFYKCYYEDGELHYLIRDCPPGFVFDETTTLCQVHVEESEEDED